MSVLRFEYRDEEGNLVERAKATFDPHGRRMDECIDPHCHNTPTHFIVTIDGMDMHTRLCSEHALPEDLQKKYKLRPDPEMAA